MHNLQCDDCKKSYTKHTWDSSVQALRTLNPLPLSVPTITEPTWFSYVSQSVVPSASKSRHFYMPTCVHLRMTSSPLALLCEIQLLIVTRRVSFENFLEFIASHAPLSFGPSPRSRKKTSSMEPEPASRKIGFIDAHFHVWDVRGDTRTGHDPKILFAPDGKVLFDRLAYESSACDLGDHIQHEGGVFLEAVSVCHPGENGTSYSQHCLNEAAFAASELVNVIGAGKYVLVPTCALEQPDAQEVLTKLSAIAGVRGIRQILNCKPDWPRNGQLGDLLDNPSWKEGFALLQKFDFSFDLQLNPHQFQKAAAFLAGHPGIPVVINHLGSPRLQDLVEDAEQYWKGMAELASLPNTYIKISMLCYTDLNWDSNRTVLDAVHGIIKLFGPERCLFATNSPVDGKDGWPPRRLLAAFLSVAKAYPEDAIQNLFGGSAKRAYRM